MLSSFSSLISLSLVLLAFSGIDDEIVAGEALLTAQDEEEEQKGQEKEEDRAPDEPWEWGQENRQQREQEEQEEKMIWRRRAVDFLFARSPAEGFEDAKRRGDEEEQLSRHEREM